jgi:hypothetical protein
MRPFLAALLATTFAVPAFASGVEGMEVRYLGGTIAGLADGQIGRFNTAAADALVFEHAGGTVAIPYASIQRYQYTQPLARRLGIAATIAVTMVKRRQRLHVIDVYYRDPAGVNQVATFELSKDRGRAVSIVLGARVRPTK